jgi:hypothetical protein
MDEKIEPTHPSRHLFLDLSLIAEISILAQKLPQSDTIIFSAAILPIIGQKGIG